MEEIHAPHTDWPGPILADAELLVSQLPAPCHRIYFDAPWIPCTAPGKHTIQGLSCHHADPQCVLFPDADPKRHHLSANLPRIGMGAMADDTQSHPAIHTDYLSVARD